MTIFADKLDLFGVGISIVSMDRAVRDTLSAAQEGRSAGVTALAVHGLILAANDDKLRALVNSIDMVTPDGQPVRWALNFLRDAALQERVSGPELMRRLCSQAATRGLPIYLFGSTPETCRKLAANLVAANPTLIVAGIQPDRFRPATPEEDEDDVARMSASGARLIFVGRGCPRQEQWVAEHRGRINAVLISVGAAFDFIAGNYSHAPAWMQKAGLEWFWRLMAEPGRLWRRYLFTNAEFLARLAAAALAKWLR